MVRITACLGLITSAILLPGCPSADATPARRPRPVTVISLTRTQPAQEAQHTGTITAWKTEDLAFQVGGRVETILEPGTNIDGLTYYDEGGNLVNEGTVIARLETRRYDLALESAKARAATAAAQLTAAESELNNVHPKQIDAAQASVTLAQQELERTKKLFDQGASTQAQLDKANADVTTTKAQLQQLQETGAVLEAQRASYAAQLNEADEAVRSAEKDLADTHLRSSFQGQIAEVYAILGGVVDAGVPVCRVQMMDPIKVAVQVSAETDAQLNYNDVVQVYPPGAEQPVEALVYEKAALADASTRTFTVTLLVRNGRIRIGMPADFDPEADVRVRELRRFLTETGERTPPYFVGTDSLHRDANGDWYLWKVNQDEKEVTRDSLRNGGNSQLMVEKVKVTLGERRLPFADVAVMQEITGFDEGTLKPETDLVIGKLSDVDGKPLDEDEGGRRVASRGYVYFVREQWKLRPGDVVRADFRGTALDSGFYVPLNAISFVSEEDPSATTVKANVFVLQQDETVQHVPVLASRVEGKAGVRKIVADGAATLGDGDRIVAEGVHFLADGEQVRVVSTVEAPR